MNLFGYTVSKIKKIANKSGSIVKSWADIGYKANWFQLGSHDPTKLSSQVAITSSAFYTCVSVISQEVARLDLRHYTNPDLSGEVEMYRSHVTRLMNKPNSYQNHSDFFLQIMFSLLSNGNSYCLAIRDTRGRVTNLIPLNPRAVQPYVVPGTDEIYYTMAQLDVDPIANFNAGDFIPQRNMLHLRLFTPTHPLIGISPLIACYPSVIQGLSIQNDSTHFFQNQAKPSGILTTPKPLDPTKASRIREAWASGTNDINSGKVPVLDNELTFQQLSLTAVESQLIEQYGMTKRDIASVFRIPLYMVGEGDSQFKTAEAAQRDFVTRTLGFYIQHVEAGLNVFFGFDGRTERFDFDVEGGIMRAEYNQRIEGLAKGVQGGIFSPNEARESENYAPMDGGDELYMQRQMVPLDLLGLDVLSMGANNNTGPDSSNSNNDSDSEDNSDSDQNTNDEKNLRSLLGLAA